MADDKTDIRLVAAILTAGQLSRMASAGGPNPDLRDDKEADYATAVYFKHLGSLVAEANERQADNDPDALKYW